MANANIQKSVGMDCTFEVDQFMKPRLCSESETIKNVVLFVLFSRPGNYPSLPYLGMDIRTMLHSYYDDINENDMEQKLTAQCAALSPYFSDGSISIKKMMYRDMPSMIIRISTGSGDTLANESVTATQRANNKDFYIGLSVNDLNELLYNINQRSS